MAITGGKITLKVEADIEQLKRQLQAAGYHVSKFKGDMKQASQTIKESGDHAAASAIKFQTLTQGAINLTTAFVQTETTISNLTKAQTSLKAAMVGVERAEDLLARKEVQLNDERKKAVPNMEKIALLTNEIRTGYKDLEVKTDRVRDQQDQLNDTYKLFALNLLNVSFSAIQTGKTMYDMAKEAQLAGKAVSFLGTNMGKVTIIALAAVVAWETLVGTFKIFGEEASKTMTISGRLSQIFEDMSNVSLKNYDGMMEKATSNQTSFNNAISRTGKELGSLKTIFDQQIRTVKELQGVTDPVKLKTLLDLYKAYGVSGGGGSPNFPSGVASVTPETKQKGVNSNVSETSEGLSFNPDGTAVNDKYESDELDATNEIIPSFIPQAYGDTGVSPNYKTSRITRGVRGRVKNVINAEPLPYAVSKASPMESYAISPAIDDFSVFLNDQEKSAYQVFNEGRVNVFDRNPINYGYGPIGTKTTLSPTFKLLSGMTKLQILSQINTQGGIVDNGYLRPLTLEESKMLYQELVNINPFTIKQDYSVQFTEGTSLRVPTPSERYQGLLTSFSDNFLKRGVELEEGGTKYSLRSSIVIKPPKLAQGVASWLKRDAYLQRNKGFYDQANALKQAAVDDYFSQFTNMAFSGNRAIGYGGIGGKIIADAILGGGAYFGTGTAGQGSKVVSTNMMRQLEAAQLAHQAIYGPNVPVGHRTNVDVSGFLGSNAVANAAQLAAMGAVSQLPGAMGFSPTAVRQGLVSVSRNDPNFAKGLSGTKVAVPAWVTQQIRQQDAWRNSVEGQNAQAAYAALTGGSFAYSQSVVRRGGGISGDMSQVIRAAGLLGVSVPYTQFQTTASDIYSTASEGLAQIIQKNGLRQDFLFAAMNAISQTSYEAVKRTMPMGFSGIRNPGASAQYNRNIHNLTQQGLQNYVSRIAAGNFGEFDATVLAAMSGAVVGEYASETAIFNSKIAPVLNIAHNDFKSTLVDPKRGINEVDDRIRWTQRLESISTGATVF